MDIQTDSVTIKVAYLAMYEFLVELYERSQSEEIGSLLGDLSVLADGTTADPAAWGDWLRCIEKARGGGVDASLVLDSPHLLDDSNGGRP